MQLNVRLKIKKIVNGKLQGTHATIIMVNECLLLVIRKREVRLLRTSHFASSIPYQKQIVRDNYDWHTEHSYVKCCTYFFGPTISQGNQDLRNPQNMHSYQTAWPVVTYASVISSKQCQLYHTLYIHVLVNISNAPSKCLYFTVSNFHHDND